MVAPVPITQSAVPGKVPTSGEVGVGALAVNVADGALYTKKKNGTVVRIEGDTGNGSIASATSIALGGVVSGYVDVTGTTTIDTIVLREGQTRTVRFTGILTLTHSSSLVLPGGANITTAAGDYVTFRGYAGGVVRCTHYTFGTAGAITVTSINKVAITAPATSATLTIANGKTFTSAATITITGTDGSTINVGTGGTLGTAAYTAASAYAAAAGSSSQAFATANLTVTGLATATTGFRRSALAGTAGYVASQLDGSSNAHGLYWNGTNLQLINAGNVIADINASSFSITGTYTVTGLASSGTGFRRSATAATAGYMLSQLDGSSNAHGVYWNGSNVQLIYGGNVVVDIKSAAVEVTGTLKSSGAFGCNGNAPQGKYASGGTLAGVVAALIANGILSN